MTGAIMTMLVALQSAPSGTLQLTDEQAAIAYDQCLARGAAKASRRNAPAEDIFQWAWSVCIAKRAKLLQGSDPKRFALFNEMDKQRKASFPERTRKLRERRQASQAAPKPPNNVDSGGPVVPTIGLSRLPIEQMAIIYDQCLARAAAKHTRSDTPEDTVYGVAKSACAPVRALLVGDPAAAPERERVLAEIDREREASFPERTRKFRQMLRDYGLEDGAAE